MAHNIVLHTHTYTHTVLTDVMVKVIYKYIPETSDEEEKRGIVKELRLGLLAF